MIRLFEPEEIRSRAAVGGLFGGRGEQGNDLASTPASQESPSGEPAPAKGPSPLGGGGWERGEARRGAGWDRVDEPNSDDIARRSGPPPGLPPSPTLPLPAGRDMLQSARPASSDLELPFETSKSATPAGGEVCEVLAALDPEQRAAAEIVDGPLLIVAGPGTGKTRTLTHRLAHLIAERGAAAEAVPRRHLQPPRRGRAGGAARRPAPRRRSAARRHLPWPGARDPARARRRGRPRRRVPRRRASRALGPPPRAVRPLALSRPSACARRSAAPGGSRRATRRPRRPRPSSRSGSPTTRLGSRHGASSTSTTCCCARWRCCATGRASRTHTASASAGSRSTSTRTSTLSSTRWCACWPPRTGTSAPSAIRTSRSTASAAPTWASSSVSRRTSPAPRSSTSPATTARPASDRRGGSPGDPARRAWCRTGGSKR